MNFKTFLISIIVLSIFCTLCASASTISARHQSVSDSVIYKSESIAETGTNLAKFGVANATFNELTDTRFALTLGETTTDISKTISAVSSNRISGKIAVEAPTVHTEAKLATLTEGSVVTTGCDASSGALGETQSSQQTSSGLSTSFPTSNYAIIKEGMTSGGTSKQSAVINTAQVGDNIAADITGEFSAGSVTSDMYTSTIKSFDKNLTQNYNEINSDHFRAIGNNTNTMKIAKSEVSSMNMSNAFDSISSSGNLSTSDIAKAIVANNSVNQTS